MPSDLETKQTVFEKNFEVIDGPIRLVRYHSDQDERAVEEIDVPSHCIIGRSRRVDLRLEGQGVSSEHASVFWDGSEWIVRDLGSRNGTQVNGLPVSARGQTLLPDDLLCFGDPEETWKWIHSAPPEPRASAPDGVNLRGESGLLFLPDCDCPIATISLSAGEWHVEMDGDDRKVSDADTIYVAGTPYTLDLPHLAGGSTMTRALNRKTELSSLELLFYVSQDEECVRVKALGPSGLDFGARAFFYPLLLLARARKMDVEAGVDDLEAGWVYASELAENMKMTREALNVDICRARQLFSKGGVLGAERLIERRRGIGQVRIGTARFTLTPLEGKLD